MPRRRARIWDVINSAMSVFDKLARIRGVTWTWNEQAIAAGREPGTADAGVLAQEVEAVYPELVTTAPEGFKQVSYTGLVGVLIEAVKELKAKNDALEQRVSELEKLVAAAEAAEEPLVTAPERVPPHAAYDFEEEEEPEEETSGPPELD